MTRDIVSYLRISQDRNDDDLAIDRQRADIADLARLRGLELGREYADKVSAAGHKRRPEFEQLVTDLDAGKIATVVAWAWDRLSRHPKDTLALIDACRVNHVKIVLVKGDDIDVTTPGGELAASVIASVARHEIAQKSARQRAQRAQEAAQGRTPPARRAFGYAERVTVPGEKYPVAHLEETEAPLVAECYRQVLAGRSMGAVARWLNEKGSTTPAGRPWTHHNLKAVLTNPRYKAVRGVKALLPGRAGEQGRREEFHTEIAPGNWPAIATPETFDAAQTILRDPARRKNHPVNTATYLLPGIAKCGTCGEDLVTGSRAYRSRETGEPTHDRLLRCRSLRHVSRKAAPIEAFVETVLLARLADPEALAVIRRKANADNGADVEELQNSIRALRARKDEATALWTDGGIDSASMVFAHRRADEQLTALETELLAAVRTDPVLELATADSVEELWRSWPMDMKRAVVAARLDVVVHPGKPGRPGGKRFDSSTVSVTWRG